MVCCMLSWELHLLTARGPPNHLLPSLPYNMLTSYLIPSLLTTLAVVSYRARASVCTHISMYVIAEFISVLLRTIDTKETNKETDKKTEEKPVEKSGIDHHLRCVL